MKVQPFLSVLLVALLLAACCPAPLAEQPTAFRGVVVGVSPDVSALHLRTPGAPLLTLSVPEGIQTGTGETVPLGALRAGDTVYIRGVLRSGELQVSEVRRLE